MLQKTWELALFLGVPAPTTTECVFSGYKLLHYDQWRIENFPQRGRGLNLRTGQFFSLSCTREWKACFYACHWRNFNCSGRGPYCAPPPKQKNSISIISKFVPYKCLFFLPSLSGICPWCEIYSFMKKKLFSVPDAFKEVTTRLKKLRWKDHKKVMICPIHFESNLFKGAKKGKFDFDRAIALYNSSGPSLLKDGLISVRQMDEKSRLIYPSNFVVNC